MATVTNLTQYFVQGALKGYVSKNAPLTEFSYVVDSAAKLNDIVRVPYTVASSSLLFDYTSGYNTSTRGQITGKPVTVDKISYIPVTLTDSDWSRLTPEVLTKLGESAGERLAGDVISASFAANVASFGNSSTYAGTSFTGSAALADLDRKANDLHWPDSGRVMLINPAMKQALLSNTSLTNAFAFGEPVAVEGQFRSKVFGFVPYTVTTTLGGLSGFAATPNALCHVFGTHNPPDSALSQLSEFTVATDPATGLVVSMKGWYDQVHATTVRILETMWGSAVGDAAAGIKIA